MNDITERLSKFAPVETDVSLAQMTTLRIGGNAHYAVYPDNLLAMDGIIQLAKEEGVPYKIFGKGSNMLCSDEYFEGIIIRLDHGFNDYWFDEDELTAEAGCSLIYMSQEAMKRGYSGLEFASGIPGTIGGGVFMNAGAYRSSMSEIVEAVYVYVDGNAIWMSAEECRFGYRTSIFKEHPDWIILAARMKLKEGETEKIRTLMDDRRKRRLASQPLDKPSAGSVFRNPDEVPAWKLIEGIGYRGKVIGGAKVSDKHVNFIINEDGATAYDFLRLVNEIKDKVREKYGIDLHMEVERFNWH